MDSVVYCFGNQTMVTNYYARKPSQLAKRELLGINRYFDILPMSRLPEIVSGSDSIFVYSAMARSEDTGFIFDDMLNTGINFQNVYMIGAGSRNLYTGMFKSKASPNEDYLTSIMTILDKNYAYHVCERFSAIVAESWHNLYWATRNKWDGYDNISHNRLNIVIKNLCSKYKLTGDQLKEAMRPRTTLHIPFCNFEKREYARLIFDCRHKLNMYISATRTRPLCFILDNNDEMYWKLDNKEYCIVYMHSLCMFVRIMFKYTLSEMLDAMGYSWIQTVGDAEKSEIYQIIINYIKELGNTQTDYQDCVVKLNERLLKLIESIYSSDNGIQLYKCGVFGLAFACKNTADLRKLLQNIHTELIKLDLENCFDTFEVCEGTRPPYCHSWADLMNSGIPITNLDKLQDTTGHINGCNPIERQQLLNEIA